MKKIYHTFLFILIHCFLFAQPHTGRIDSTKIQVPAAHYMEEYTLDTPLDFEAWNNQKPGLQVSFGSANNLYFRSELPALKSSTLFEETAWRGERVNVQLLTWAADTVDQVRIIPGDLKNQEGATIRKEHLHVFMVRYVLSNFPYGATNTNCWLSPYKDAFLMPDRLEEFDRYTIPGHSVRPVWLSVDIPAEVSPGIYEGTIQVKSEKHTTALTLKIKVQPNILPPPKAWKHRLDLWQNPWVIAWYYKVKPWSEEHKVLLRKHLKLYADAGGKYITTYAVHSPWSDNSFMIEGTMIDWIRQRDGTWKFDYTIFDQYVTLAMETGIDEAITIYTLVPWGNRFRYRDESTGNYVYEEWAPDSETFKKFWNIFLDDLKVHLQKKGWFGKTYLGINENELTQTLAAIGVIDNHDKAWKITYAGNWHKELEDLLDDFSFLYGNEPGMEEVKKRHSKGFTSTYYVCCNPAKPNNFVFSPPIEGRWISWYTAAYGYDGFLRWAYDAWPQDPSRDARHLLWPAGDSFLVYPGASSSIRYEKLREGIVDYEKIRILKDLAAKSTDKNVKRLWREFEQHLSTFTSEREFKEEVITEAVSKGKNMINELSEKLR
jgi:hypothetical protein